MRTVLTSLALLVSASLASAADMLVTPAWLLQHTGDANLVLLHVGPKADFEKEHIPGARLVSGQDLSIPRVEGALILQLLPPESLREKLESLGIGDGSRVVVCFGKDWVSPATRIYFSLDAAGLGDHASLLDGGLPAWKAAGGPVTAEPTPPRPPGKITAPPRPELVAGLDAVRAALDKPGLDVVDSRLPQFYEGKEAGSMPRAGHIPGAKSLPFDTLLTDALLMKSAAETRELFRAAGIEPGDTVVSYCHIGQQATVVYFAAKRLGLKARLYDGSWDEWSRRTELPVETDGARPPSSRRVPGGGATN
jgi:thiosulfate/3-mercaptopyruvate sulfurtransferase